MSTRSTLPTRRGSLAFTFEDQDGRRYRAHISRFDDGRLGEVFLDTGKAGASVQQFAETAAILASLCLQHGVSAETIRHAVGGPLRQALDIAEGQP